MTFGRFGVGWKGVTLKTIMNPDIKSLCDWLHPEAANKEPNRVIFQSGWYKLPKREVLCYLIRFGFSIQACEDYFGRGSSVTRAYTRFWQCFRYSELDWQQKRHDWMGFKTVMGLVNKNRKRAGMAELEYKY